MIPDLSDRPLNNAMSFLGIPHREIPMVLMTGTIFALLIVKSVMESYAPPVQHPDIYMSLEAYDIGETDSTTDSDDSESAEGGPDSYSSDDEFLP